MRTTYGKLVCYIDLGSGNRSSIIYLFFLYYELLFLVFLIEWAYQKTSLGVFGSLHNPAYETFLTCQHVMANSLAYTHTLKRYAEI